MQLRHLAALLVVLLTHSSSVYAGVRPRWADVTLRDGVYKNVLVAVGPGVQQDDGLIEHIKVRVRVVLPVSNDGSPDNVVLRRFCRIGDFLIEKKVTSDSPHHQCIEFMGRHA